ncbi:MAG: hypothetical protein V1819_01180, partial [bacterium]
MLIGKKFIPVLVLGLVVMAGHFIFTKNYDNQIAVNPEIQKQANTLALTALTTTKTTSTQPIKAKQTETEQS